MHYYSFCLLLLVIQCWTRNAYSYQSSKLPSGFQRQLSNRPSKLVYCIKKSDNSDKSQDSKSVSALIKTYGRQYLLTWIAVYLPCLCSFFYMVENKKNGVFTIDIDAMTQQLNRFGSMGLDLSKLKENEHILNFAVSYLAADLVPTTLIAITLLSYYNSMIKKDNDKEV